MSNSEGNSRAALESLISYLNEVFSIYAGLFGGISFVLTLIELIIAALNDEPPQLLKLAPVFTLLLAVIFFAGANFKLYMGLLRQIESLNKTNAHLLESEADIEISCSSNSFGTLKPSGRYSYEYDNDGLPIGGRLWMELSYANLGYKPGFLEATVTKCTIRKPFTDNPTIQGIYVFEISGQSTKRQRCHCDFNLIKQDSKEFARQLRLLRDQTYILEIGYKTKRLGANNFSQARALTVKGDFTEFYKSVVGYWERHGLNELIRIAEGV